MEELKRLVSWPAVLMVMILGHLEPLEAQSRAADEFVPVTDAMLRDPDPEDWLMSIGPTTITPTARSRRSTGAMWAI